jgi:hypothetical protein
MSGAALSPTDIEARLEEAAATLKKLPGIRMGGFFSTWPAIIRTAAETYAQDRTLKVRIPPTAQAISRMEETFDWLGWLDADDTRLVWLRAEGVRWKPICWQLGVSRATAWRRWAAAMIEISRRASRQPRPVASSSTAAGGPRLSNPSRRVATR